MESFATIANDFQPLNIVAKLSIIDVCGVPGYAFGISIYLSHVSPTETFHHFHKIRQFTLHEIYQNTGFLSLYGKIRVRENTCSGIFYVVLLTRTSRKYYDKIYYMAIKRKPEKL